MNWFFVFSGVRSPAMAILWGGLLGCLGYLGLLWGGYRHVNCHVKHCPRIAKHEYEMKGVKYKICTRHHPVASKPTAQSIIDHHNTGTVVKKRSPSKSGLAPAKVGNQ